MGDGVESSCSQIGVLPVRDGLDRPVDVGRGAFPVAPLFADFAGKSWECEFPRILAAYYDSFRFLGLPGLRYNDDGGNFVCSCSLLPFGGRRNAESFDSVSCRGEGVGDGDGRGGGDATYSGATRRGDGAAGSSFVDAELCEDGAPKIQSVSGDRFPGAVVRGKHYESNKRKRLSRRDAERKKKEERMSGSWREAVHVDGVSQDVPTFREFVEAEANRELVDDKARALEEKMANAAAVQRAKRTLAEKWAAENELAVMKAKQGIKLLESKDMDLEVKKRDSYAKMQNERNLVNMEKAHQTLKRTGNVPGFAQTVLSDDGLTDGSSAQASPNGCTISPDSSASMKEFRELAKKCADQQDKLDKFHKMTKIHPDYIDLYKKQTWTINSENVRILDEMYPQGHALNPIPDYENYDAPTHGELIVGSDEEYFPY